MAVAFALDVGTGVAPPLTVPGFAVAAGSAAFGDGEAAVFTDGTGEARLLPPFVFDGTGVTLAPLTPGFSDAAGAIVAPFFVVAAGEGDALPFLPPGTGVAAAAPVFLSFWAVEGFTFGVGVATWPAPLLFHGSVLDLFGYGDGVVAGQFCRTCRIQRGKGAGRFDVARVDIAARP